jgi:hypothetical protein
MKFTFLSAQMPLTKSYTKQPDGSILKSSYPHAYEFTSHEEDIKSLTDLETSLQTHAAAGHCLLKGNPAKRLSNESRAGSTSTETATQWICFDIDGLDVPTIDTFMDYVGMGEISYVVQWSASYGIENKQLRGHVFVFIDRMVPAPLVKQWLIQLNHTVAPLRAAMGLTKTGHAISWALDITACQNDKLLYIAPPVLKGIKNPLNKDPRISLVKKKTDVFTFPQTVNAGKNQDLTDKRIAELRAESGMTKRKLTTKNGVLLKADACDATDIRQARGFVYFNINGGDSWSYYHPEDNPKYIFNFKGEPVYLTSELLPDYWATLMSQGPKANSDGIIHLAFCDRRTSTYYKGTYDQAQEVLDLTPAKSLKILESYMDQFGVPNLGYIPEWEMLYDPHATFTIDWDSRTINTFQLSEYMKGDHAKIIDTCPPTIFKVLHHALGSDTEITEHYINWLAYIVQKRDMTITAWVLHGVQGTGKGLLIDNILRPLFGKNIKVVTMKELASTFNPFMQDALICVCEEMQSSSFEREDGIVGVLKQWIASKMCQIRRMYTQEVDTRVYANWMFPSNETDVIKIPKNDRRFNVAKYQSKMLNDGNLDKSQADIDRIPKELQTFYDYLYHYPVNEIAVRKVLDTEDREQMMDISENSIDATSRHLLEGNMEWFIDQLPTSNRPNPNAAEQNKIDDYKHTLKDLLLRTDALTGKCNIARDELRTIFERTVGKQAESSHRFTSMLKNHRIHTKKVRVGENTVYGLAVTFQDVANFDKYLKASFGQKVKT